jgi:uncharacterized RDD family membrane protein YckC
MWEANHYNDYEEEEEAEPVDEDISAQINAEPAVTIALEPLNYTQAELIEALQAMSLTNKAFDNETKPEEQPPLTEIYVTALETHESVEEQVEDQSVAEYYLKNSFFIDNSEQILNQDELHLEQDWQFFLHGCSTALHTDAARTDTSYWQFLKNIKSLKDLEFKDKTSIKLFGYIADANIIALDKKTLYIKTPVLNFLDDIFDWQNQASYLREKFSLKKVDAVITYIDKTDASSIAEFTGAKRYPYRGQKLLFWRRMGAGLTDIVIACFILLIGAIILLIAKPYGLDKAVEDKITNGFSSLFVLYFIGIMPILEIKYQASLGKQIFGLKIVNKYGEKIKWYQSFGRFLLFLLGLSSWPFWVANLILSFRKGIFLHDDWSQSYVVNKVKLDFIN